MLEYCSVSHCSVSSPAGRERHTVQCESGRRAAVALCIHVDLCMSASVAALPLLSSLLSVMSVVVRIPLSRDTAHVSYSCGQ